MRELVPKIALLALPAFTNAVALSDLKPRASNLPPACQQVYIQQIPGCTADDFRSRDCSSACFNGLEGLVQPIRDACGNQGVVGQNLIVAFLANVGPQQICPNYQASGPGTWTGPGGYGPGQYSATPPWAGGHTSWGSHTATSTTSSSMQETSAPKTSYTSTRVSYSGTSTASTVQTTSGTLVFDTSSTPTTAPATQTGASQTGASQTGSQASANPQTNLHDGSGGGSPFDTAGNTASPNSAGRIPLSMAVTCVSICAALLSSLR